MIDYVLCVSWGNDSVAMIQLALEMQLENVAILYNDTGWADASWPSRVAELEAWATSEGFSCYQTQSEGMEALVKRKKGWPRQGIQFCTEHLKILPTIEWLAANAPMTAICATGVKRVDSKNRKDTPEYITESSAHGGRFLWHPLYLHSEYERDQLLLRAGVEPLPHRSKECGICVNEKREGLRNADPNFVAKVERIENEMGFTSNGAPRTMFRPYRYMHATGIREIIQWANSEHGQFNPDDGTGYDCDSGMCGL